MDAHDNIIYTISIYLQTHYLQSLWWPLGVQHYRTYSLTSALAVLHWQYVQSELVNNIYSFPSEWRLFKHILQLVNILRGSSTHYSPCVIKNNMFSFCYSVTTLQLTNTKCATCFCKRPCSVLPCTIYCTVSYQMWSGQQQRTEYTSCGGRASQTFRLLDTNRKTEACGEQHDNIKHTQKDKTITLNAELLTQRNTGSSVLKPVWHLPKSNLMLSRYPCLCDHSSAKTAIQIMKKHNKLLNRNICSVSYGKGSSDTFNHKGRSYNRQ